VPVSRLIFRSARAPRLHRLAALAAALALLILAPPAPAAPKTVCTITVNSSDEREVLKSALPASDFRFVELVERGRPDWLESACRQKVRCDVLVISGHFDGGTEFYTDRLDDREYLPVHEMERVACSESCPGLFSHLKEVYLFGCNTLNAQAMRSAGAEVARSLVRAGHSPADAEALSRLLSDRHGESNRDRMRHIFKDVPVIYGFPDKAPLGRYAGPLLERYLRSGGSVGSGRVDPKLLATFGASAMTATAGITDDDPRAGFRRDVCRFADDRLADAGKLDFVHEVLGRDMGEVRMFLDHLKRYTATLPSATTMPAATHTALAAIAADARAKGRYLEFAADADEPGVRVRMLALAQRWGWISPDEERRLVADIIAGRLVADAAGVADVELACSLNRDGSLDAEHARLAAGRRLPGAAQSAMLACLGSSEGRAGVLRAWSGDSPGDVVIAQAYLAHRPVTDAAELRQVAHDVARMKVPEAQVRALDALSHHRLDDADALRTLATLFAQARSADVQRAAANVMLRGDYAAIATPAVVASLRRTRLRAGGDDVVDALVRRLDAVQAHRPDVPRASLELR